MSEKELNARIALEIIEISQSLHDSANNNENLRLSIPKMDATVKTIVRMVRQSDANKDLNTFSLDLDSFLDVKDEEVNKGP